MDPGTLAALIQGGGALAGMFGSRNAGRAAGRSFGQLQDIGQASL